MSFTFLIVFGVLYLSAKLMETKRVAFYWAALIYVATIFSIQSATLMIATSISQGGNFHDSFTSFFSLLFAYPASWLLKYIVAAITLYFLDRFEDTMANWLIIFLIGYTLLAFVA